MGIHNYYSKKNKVEKINFNNNTYPIRIKDLKQYSDKNNFNEKKEMLDIYSIDKDNLNWEIIINNLVELKAYEVYINIDDGKQLASNLLKKTFNNIFKAKIYALYLKLIINVSNIEKIAKKLASKPKK